MAILLVVAAAAVAVSRSPLFAVTRVRVDGVTGARAQRLRETAGVRVGHNLVGVDLAAAVARAEALPWVAAVSPPRAAVDDRVRRRGAPAGRRGAHLRRRVRVDTDGWVVAPGPRRGLVDIAAPGAIVIGPGRQPDDPALRDALNVHACLPDDMASAVVRYDAIDDDLRLVLRLLLDAGSGRVTVRLGDDRRVGEKIAALRALLVTPGRGVRLHGAVVDVRAPDNPVVLPAP